MNTAFETYRYIQRRMKACGVPKGAVSTDTDERILSLAQRALKPHWPTGNRTEELVFNQVGDRWHGSLIRL